MTRMPDDRPPEPDVERAQALHDTVGPLRARIAAHPEGALAFACLGELEDLLWHCDSNPVLVWECFARLAAALPFPVDDPAVLRLASLLPIIPT